MMKLLRGELNKFIVALVGAALTWLGSKGLHVDPSSAQAIGGVITAVLVWLIPNKGALSSVGKALAVLFVVMAVAPLAHADTKTLSWIPPTMNTDGSTLDPASDLSTYFLGCGSTTGDRTTFTQNWPAVVNGNAVKSHALDFAPGTWYCSLQVSNTAGARSDWSGEVNFTIAVRPNAPTGFSVN